VVLAGGIDEAVQGAYRFIYEPEDGDELYLFGGAYTVRSLAGLMSCSIVHDQIFATPEAYEVYREKNDERRCRKSQAFRDSHLGRVPITLLGCWDTVVMRNTIKFPYCRLMSCLMKYKFHDTILSSIIQHALHAVAIDEKRKVFDVTPMKRIPTIGIKDSPSLVSR